MRREFIEGELVLLFKSRLILFPGKLRSRWSGPFIVTRVFQNGVVKIKSKSKETLTVNGQRLKHYHCVDNVNYYASLKLEEFHASSPSYKY